MVTELSLGQEIMRSDYGTQEVKELKNEFVKLFDILANKAMEAQAKIDNAPQIYSDESIKQHMETIKKCEESLRCYAEASKIIEMSCLYAIKGLTA